MVVRRRLLKSLALLANGIQQITHLGGIALHFLDLELQAPLQEQPDPHHCVLEELERIGLQENLGDGVDLIAPPELDFGPQDLKRANYRSRAATYRAQGIPAYPAHFTSIAKTVSFHHDFAFVNLFDSVAAEIIIPEGYKAKRAYVVANFMRPRTGDLDWVPNPAAARARVSVSDKRKILHNYIPNTANRNRVEIDLDDQSGTIPFSVTGWYTGPTSFTFEIECELDLPGRHKWQLEVYERIVQAHSVMVAEFEEKRAAILARLNTPQFGRNPLENRQVERDELKRAAVQVLLAQVTDTLTSDNYARVARLFETAFEWDNLTYQLLPYYWTARGQWAMISDIEDRDPIHQRFLKAGGAIAVAPVRNEFAEQILGFFNTGNLAGGLVADEQLSVIQDLLDQPTDVLAGVPQDDPGQCECP